MHVLGTAGHVDHGKSAFLRLLTGMEPDRLPDEKRTGMTIDLNFVWWDPPGGERIGVIDVPGHKRFVKNMITGVMNIDAFVFLVAADDGWMPQSEDHLQVLSAMGITNGIVVISKRDLVDDARFEEVRADIADRFRRALGREVTVFPFSAVAPTNLGEIRAALEEMVGGLAPADDREAGRLWIDRVFTPRGQGVIVTGTLREGSLRIGDPVWVLPAGVEATVRGLQSYKRTIEVARPVSRVAVQLARVEAKDLERGNLLQTGKRVPVTRCFDGILTLLPKEIEKAIELPVHVGSARARARILPLGPAKDGVQFVRAKLEIPLPLRHGDRFLLRTPGEEKNCGGGVVVEPDRIVKTHREALRRFSAWAPGPIGLVRYEAALSTIVDLEEAWNRSAFSRAELKEALAGAGFVPIGEGAYALAESWEKLLGETLAELAERHEAGRDAVPPGELLPAVARRAGAGERAVELAIATLEARGDIRRAKQGIAATKFSRRIEPWEAETIAFMEKAFAEGRPLVPAELPGDPQRQKALVARLLKEGALVGLREGAFIGAGAYQAVSRAVTEHLRAKGSATTSELRQLLNTSRKNAVLLLERMDRDRLTFLKDGIRKLLK